MRIKQAVRASAVIHPSQSALRYRAYLSQLFPHSCKIYNQRLLQRECQLRLNQVQFSSDIRSHFDYS